MIHNKAALLLLLALSLLGTGLLRFPAAWVAAQEVPPSVRPDLPVSPPEDLDPRNGTSVAVSPVDERIIVGASKVVTGGGGNSTNGITRVAYYFSSDGGGTWGSSILGLETPQKTFGRATHPSVAVDLNGTFYLCVLMLDNQNKDNGVFVFKSTDGGRNFVDPIPAFVEIGNNVNPKTADRCYITVDTSATSPFKNSVYATWVSSEPAPTGGTLLTILTSYRRPGSVAFSAPKAISHSGNMLGPSPATGPNGEFYAVWEGIGNPRVLLFNASTDGGDTFLPPDIAPGIDFRLHRYNGSLTEPGGAINIDGVSRMNSFPVIAVDKSNGPNRGVIHVAFAETTNSLDSDIFVIRLTPPNGARPLIDDPVKVNNDGAGINQFFPWISIDDSDGSVNVAFYDMRDDNGQLANMYLARSTNGGGSYGDNIRVSRAGSNPRIQANVGAFPSGSRIGIGDYIGLAAARGKAHLLWTDTRNGKQEIFYSNVSFNGSGGGGGGDVPPVNDACDSPRQIDLLPFTDAIDTGATTSSASDPTSCSGGKDTHTVWYSITPSVSTVYGIDTVNSAYDTVLSVYTGACGALTRVACNDDFGGAISPANRSVLTFTATAGTTYLIEASGKGSGGALQLRFGVPTVTGVQFVKKGPDGTPALRITGAGFVEGATKVVVQFEGADTELPSIVYSGARQGDSTFATIFATKAKLKKLAKAGRTIVVRVETAGGVQAIPFSFSRP